jgi:uncharacterized repeat protein (TIGR03806 family)
MRWLLLSLFCLASALFARSGSALPSNTISDVEIASPTNPLRLSAFGFFDGGADRPNSALIGYTLGTPLFSDYSEKQRFIYLPKSTRLSVAADGVVSFPVGSALIKNFGYPDASGNLKIIETRVLLHRAEGWVALPYVWQADGRDAELKLGGIRVPVAFKKTDGTAMQISYAVPNKNQCKQCHSTKGEMTPIGPVWQNLDFKSAAVHKAIRARADFAGPPILAQARWHDAKTGNVEQRALSYLRANCGHCHKPSGSASNSGLFFADHPAGGAALGIKKRPVAAGRGAGNFDYVVDPGHPERSILIHRMKSTDPGVAMPELGRATIHDEGIALLEEWVKGMKP